MGFWKAFSDFFKPSPETLKAREDAKRAKSFNTSISTILDQLCDLEKLTYDQFDWDYYKAMASAAEEALENIGKSNLEQIIKYLKEEVGKPAYGEYSGNVVDSIPLIWALCEIGDRRATEGVVDWIFKFGPKAPLLPLSLQFAPLIYEENSEKYLLSPPDLIRKIVPPGVLPKLLGDYTDVILDIFAWQFVPGQSEKDLRVDSSRCYTAVHRLCDIKTPISNNILHKVSKVKRLETFCRDTYLEIKQYYLNFSSLQKIALEEIRNRGNPNYNLSAYLEEGAFKIK